MRDRDFAEVIAVLVGDYQFICFVCLLAPEIFSGKKKEKGGIKWGK